MPNPFVYTTNFLFNIEEDYSLVELYISDMLGSFTTKVLSEYMEKGVQSVQMKANNLSSGVFSYRLIINRKQYSGLIILNK